MASVRSYSSVDQVVKSLSADNKTTEQMGSEGTPTRKPSWAFTSEAVIQDAGHNQHEPLRLGSNLTPVPLPRRTTIQSAAQKTTRIFRRFRQHARESPIDPSLVGVSKYPKRNPQPRGGPAQCGLEEVFAEVLPKDGDSAKFPEFDALSSYHHSESTLKHLWRDETRRLMDIAQHPDRPLEFSSNGFFRDGTEEGYRELSRLCQRILNAITICLLDNECINAEHCGQMSNRERMSSLIRQVSKGQSAAESAANSDDPKIRQRELQSLDAVYSLINYISAVMTRMIIQTSPGCYWQTNVLSVLIKRITKVKVLLIDLHANSAIAVRAGEAVLSNMQELRESMDGEMDAEEECEEYLRLVEANEKEGTASYEEKQIAAHCVEQNKFRYGLNSALRFSLMSMRFINRSGLPATTFEICAVAYETGFEGFKALLFQDRDLEYSATSDLDNMNTAHTAFNILNQTVVNITRPRGTKYACDALETTLEWAYSGSESDDYDSTCVDLAQRKKSLRLSSMDEIITVMVPLTVTSPMFLAEFTNFRHVMAMTGFIRDDVQPYAEGQFSAFFRMYTNRFDDDVERRDVLRLSEALDSGFFSRSSLVLGSDHNRKDLSRPKAQQNALHELEELTKYMDEWVIDENCVTVQCGWYVWSVITVAVMFAGGGLGIGFSVGERINGVDPSNLATYLWVVAAFIVLIAKSMHVKEWSWNDFLRRRVRCCSVSELQSITGIDGQLIIAKLLHDERRGSVLKVRGPYNSVFLSRSTDGFSIDSPISSSTLLLSGLTMLKVVTAKGHALVCLDSRRGTDLRIIGHNTDPKQEQLFCEQIDRLQGRAKDSRTVRTASQAHIKLPFTRSSGLKWKRVQGIYKFMDAKFV